VCCSEHYPVRNASLLHKSYDSNDIQFLPEFYLRFCRNLSQLLLWFFVCISCTDSNLHPFKLNFIFGNRKVFVGDITPIGWLWKNWSSAWFQASAGMEIKSAVFWDFTERRMVVPYRRFGTAFWSNLQGFSGLLYPWRWNGQVVQNRR